MKTRTMVALLVALVALVCQAGAQEWTTPEALRAFGQPGDTVKARPDTGRKSKSAQPAEPGPSGSRHRTFAQQARSACTEDTANDDCTSYRVVGTPPVKEEPPPPNRLLLIVR